MILKENETFLGLDLSTQKLKAVQLNTHLEVIAQAEVKFDTDLQHFRTVGGVNPGEENNEFYVSPTMWVRAVDLVLDRLLVQGGDFNSIVAISGSAQQHGSVYWSDYGLEILNELDADKFLHTQINDGAFTIHHTPIWMDGTTEQQCIEMEEAIGGRDVMVNITGSKGYARFTGPQIRKIYQQRTRGYEKTKRISLVSSFLATLFLGEVAPIDFADASGMNLLDIKEKKWSMTCLNACAPDLEERLGVPVPTNSVIGTVSKFMVQRHGFNPDCKIIAFTGDNPSALAGMLIAEDWLAISLGTSDTIMMGIKERKSMEEGHVLVHPTDDELFMGLLCFRNGSLVRDIFKRSEGNDNWEYFSELLGSTTRGNYGNMALHFLQMEIIPPVKGQLRWNKLSNSSNPELAKGVIKFASPQTEIRALIEGQMLHRKAVATDMGFNFGENTRILATGGGSANKAILQVMADVFNAPVYKQKSTEAAVLGAAYRAKYVHSCCTEPQSDSKISYFDYISKLLPNHMQRICEPQGNTDDVYEQMEKRYREMINVLVKQAEAANNSKNLNSPGSTPENSPPKYF